MEATCSSETSVDFQHTTRRYVLEEITLREAQELSTPPPPSPMYCNDMRFASFNFSISSL
jgi:hypothetical protein